jgi:hypothetical protein
MEINPERNLEIALFYAKNGWPVFPIHSIYQGQCACRGEDCPHPGKHPITAHGHLDATTDEEQIRDWWGRWRSANIGLPTGRRSGVCVLDIDPRNDGWASLQKLAKEHGDISSDVVCETGGGGEHLYYESNGASTTKIAPGLDLKAEGGYVILPLSKHISGGIYQWKRGHSFPEHQPPACPEWLGPVTAEDFPMEYSEREPPPDAYPEGSRNDALFRDACSLVNRHSSADVLLPLVQALNEAKCDPPLGDREVESIVNQALGYVERDEITEPVKVSHEDEAKVSFSGIDITPLDLSTLLDEPDMPIPWVIPGWKCDKEVLVLAGEWFAGKSLMCLDLGLNQARFDQDKATFFDHCELRGGQKRVLYIGEEDPEPVVRKRIKQLCRARGISQEELRAAPFRYLCMKGLILDDPKRLAAFRRAVDTFEPDEIYYDSLSRAHFRDENSNSQMAQFFATVLRDLHVDYQVGMTFSHHMGKPSKDGYSDPRHRVRGASDIPAWFQVVWTLDYHKPSRTLSHQKTRWDELPPPLTVRFIKSEDEKELLLTASEILPKADKLCWDFLEDNAEAGCLRQHLVNALLQEGESKNNSSKVVSRLLKKWGEEGKVVKRQEGKQARYWLSRFGPLGA